MFVRKFLHHSTPIGKGKPKSDYFQKREAQKEAILKEKESKDLQKSRNKISDLMIVGLYKCIGFEAESPTQYHIEQKPAGISKKTNWAFAKTL